MTMLDYTLGRGKLYFNGRYLGGSDSFAIRRQGQLVVFSLEDISDENLNLFFGIDARGKLKFKADNPVGRNIHYDIADVILIGENHELKSDEWLKLRFIGLPQQIDGVLMTYTVDGVIHEVRHDQ